MFFKDLWSVKHRKTGKTGLYSKDMSYEFVFPFTKYTFYGYYHPVMQQIDLECQNVGFQ